MPGIRALRKLQIGREGLHSSSDAGTATAATALLRFEGVWSDDLEVVFPLENVGYISGRDRTYINKYEASMAMEGASTFEQLPYILEASIANVSSPTTDSGTGVQYLYTFPTTAQGSISVYTIEGGDDQQEEEASFAFVSDFELSGNSGEAWMVSANWMARQADTNSFTTSSDVTVTEVEEMLFLKSKLYIDDISDSDSLGTTLVSNTLLEASLQVNSGWIPKYTADGQLYFSFIARTGFEALLDITFEHDSTAVAEKAAWRAETPRAIRILCEGSALSTTDTYGVKSMYIDLAGKWENFDVLGDRDGNDIVSGTFRARYNTDANHFGSILVVNELASLP